MNAAQALAIANSGSISDEQIEQLICDSDNHKTFFKDCGDTVEAVSKLANAFVSKFLNNPDQTAVPLRRKTKFLLVLNNLAMERKFRTVLLSAITEMDAIFEESMKKEGTMAFDSELGRMSEHMLVLLMRATNYKLKAGDVLEFAESGGTSHIQFGVQLCMAIMLKEPAYEVALRINCISCLLGFTQPHTFFSAGESSIKSEGCGKFGEKVDFIANLMLRLSAVQVVNDVLTPHLLEVTAGPVPPLFHVGVTHMMRSAMNIFHFAATASTKWRQHILVSTSFVDGCSILYLQAQVRHLDSLFSKDGQLISSVSADLLGGIGTTLKFMAFATFHMGKYGRCIRPLCTFITELSEIKGFATLLKPELGAATSNGAVQIIVNLLHFLSNIDALAGDDEIISEEGEEALAVELKSSALASTVKTLATRIVAAVGVAGLTGIRGKFAAARPDSLVSTDTATFSAISAALESSAAAATAPAPAAVETSSGGASGADRSKQQAAAQAAHAVSSTGKKVSAEEAAQVSVSHNFSANVLSSAPKQTGEARFLCALNQHTMKNPVTSPYGHHFEKEVIEQWLRQKGNVCPFSGKPLTLAELKPNPELQSEIMQQVILQTMASNAYNADETDMYDF